MQIRLVHYLALIGIIAACSNLVYMMSLLTVDAGPEKLWQLADGHWWEELFGISTHQKDGDHFDHVLSSKGFRFARTVSEFLLEAAFFRDPNEESSFFYSERDIRIIERSMNTMRGFMNMGVWSASPALHHFIGTGACLLKLQRPPEEVALGLLHGMYLQRWRDHVFHEETCDQRHELAQAIGTQLEKKLWLHTALFGNGPWSTCISCYRRLLTVNANLTEPGDEFIAASFSTLTSPYLHLIVCDEIEETFGGDLVLGGNWKRRDVEFFKGKLIPLAEALGETELIGWIEDAMAVTHALHHPNPGQHYKELTPKPDDLIQSAEFNSNADKKDIDRLKFATRLVHEEKKITRPYLPPFGQKEVLRGIFETRNMCDKVESGEKTLMDLVKLYKKLQHLLLHCERTDERFKDPIPMPDLPPDSAEFPVL
eukprot:scaffold760_cov168-Amphora_coffeaeformis.AAC.1